jgi:chromosome segregation ATPase
VQIEWLEGLETKVREAVDRLADLREENRQLNARLEELETELAAAGTPGTTADTAGLTEEVHAELAQERQQGQELRRRLAELQDQLDAQAAEAETAQAEWERERDEIRGRVETLTQRLEDLLGV